MGQKKGAVLGAAAYVVSEAVTLNSEKWFSQNRLSTVLGLEEVLPETLRNAKTGKEYLKAFINWKPDFSLTSEKLIKFMQSKPAKTAALAGGFAAAIGLSALIGKAIGTAHDKIKNKVAAKIADAKAQQA